MVRTAGEIEQRARRLRRVARVARLTDTAFKIPGTRIRLGLDSVVGLIPGIGDTVGVLVALYIVYEARQLGLPNTKIARMLGNAGLDYVIGLIPLLGDVADVFFKGNRRNLDIILDHFGHDELRRHDDVHEDEMIDVTPRART